MILLQSELPLNLSKESLTLPKPLRYVYFIGAFKDNDLQAIKIGSTRDLPGRLQALQTGSMFELRVLGFGLGSKADEHAIQKRFSSERISGEWFNPTSEILKASKEGEK